MRSPHGITLLNQIQNLIIVVDELLFETSDLNHVVFILSQTELLMLVQEIVEFATINLIHRNGNSEIPLMIFPIVDTSLEQILHSDTLKAVHSVGFSRASLPIRKNGDDALIENKIQNWTNLVEVKLLVGLAVREGIIKSKLSVFDCFGHSIYFVLAIVDDDLWVGHRYDVNLTIRELLLENGALLEAHTDLHLVGENVLPAFGDLFPLGFDHGLKINIYLDTLELIIGFSLTLKFTGFFHSETSSIPVDFNLINLVSGGDLSGWDHIRLQTTHLNTGTGDSWVDPRFRLGNDTKLLLEAILSLLGSTVSG